MPAVSCPNCKHSMVLVSSHCPLCGYELAPGLFTSSKRVSAPPSSPATSPIFGMGSTPSPLTRGAARSTPSAHAPSAPTASSAVSSPSGKVGVKRSTFSELSGMIIDPPTTLEMPHRIDWSHIVLGLCFLPFSLLFLIIFLANRDNPAHRTLVTRIRVQAPDGTVREARIEGDFLGVGLSQGDQVELYGTNRVGVLVVKQGYNHSASAGLSIHYRNSPIGARVLASIVLALYALCILSTFLPLLFSAISSSR